MSRTIGLSFAVGAMALTGALLFASPSQAQTEGEILEEEETPEEKTEEKAPDEDDGEDGGWSDSGESGGGGGLHLGLRLGFGFPTGKIHKPRAYLSDAVLGQIPIWVDLGYQLSPRLMLGAYFSFGFGILAEDASSYCDENNLDCSATVMRVGVQGQYNFSPGQSMNPWLGAGIGYEWFTAYQDDNSYQYHGWELPMIQGGLDFGGDSAGSTIGPFVAFTLSTYTKFRSEVGSSVDSGDVDPNDASHSWIFVGIRGVLN